MNEPLPTDGGDKVEALVQRLSAELVRRNAELREERAQLRQERDELTQRLLLMNTGHRAALNLIEDAVHSRQEADAAIAKLQAAEATLETTVAQRTAQLRETLGEFEAFSYSIAHDLRAPLRSLQGFGQVLSRQYAPKLDAAGQEYVRRITESAQRMDQLIQDVLNYSIIVRAELPMESVDISTVIYGIVESYPGMGRDEANIFLQDPLPKVQGNQASLVQCFANLIGNAIKFVPAGVKPEIRIWAESRDSRIRIYIKDNGIGISHDQHHKVFGMFERVSLDYEGTGIGLAIVKKSVDRMGGTIGIDSELGCGTTFWIDLNPAEQ